MKSRGEGIGCYSGGEEFMLILPGTSLDGTRRRAEHLRRVAKGLNARHYGQPLGTVTLSLGVAGFPDHGATAEAVLRAAEQALRRAKAEGCDRVVVGQSLPPTQRSPVLPESLPTPS